MTRHRTYYAYTAKKEDQRSNNKQKTSVNE